MSSLGEDGRFASDLPWLLFSLVWKSRCISSILIPLARPLSHTRELFVWSGWGEVVLEVPLLEILWTWGCVYDDFNGVNKPLFDKPCSRSDEEFLESFSNALTLVGSRIFGYTSLKMLYLSPTQAVITFWLGCSGILKYFFAKCN